MNAQQTGFLALYPNDGYRYWHPSYLTTLDEAVPLFPVEWQLPHENFIEMSLRGDFPPYFMRCGDEHPVFFRLDVHRWAHLTFGESAAWAVDDLAYLLGIELEGEGDE